ncbi:MAG: hypothetical protein QM632_05665 [Micrococcaceae bacterium]
MTKLSATAMDIVNCPPNLIPPETFISLIEDKLKNTDYKVSVYRANDLADMSCGSLLAFGSGSKNSPALVKIESSNPSGLHIIAEGTIVELGGLQLIPRSSTINTKVGKAGAAIAVETLVSSSSAATFWIPLAENIPSQGAARPGDVVTLPNGFTIEALELKAEGHLALFDAYVLAAEDGAEKIISISSCDPIQNVAVGHLYSTIIGNEPAVTQLVDAAKKANEKVWPLPLSEFAAEAVKSEIADTANAAAKVAPMLANCSVFQTVLDNCDNTPHWAHWDLGTASYHHEKYSDQTGATGHGAATLKELVAN